MNPLHDQPCRLPPSLCRPPHIRRPEPSLTSSPAAVSLSLRPTCHTASQAARNSRNCGRLRTLIQHADREVAAVVSALNAGVEGSGKGPSASLRLGMARVTRVVLVSARLVHSYTGDTKCSWLVRFVSANVDREKFEGLEKELAAAMAVGVGKGRPAAACCCLGALRLGRVPAVEANIKGRSSVAQAALPPQPPTPVR